MPGGKDFSYADVPDQTGKTILITGCTGGLGMALVRDFLEKTNCAKVIMANRNLELTKYVIQTEFSNDPRCVPLELELGHLEQVKQAAVQLIESGQTIDTLILNAGCINETRKMTKDGKFELTLGINLMGHFAFTAIIWPLVQRSSAPRVVHVSSAAHEWTKTGMDLEDLNWEKRKYAGLESYNQAKLGVVLFQKEMVRRALVSSDTTLASRLTVIGLSPGYARSGLVRNLNCFARCLIGCTNVQPHKLSINTMRAATDLRLQSGDYLNPKSMKFYGPPVLSQPSKLAEDPIVAAKLWEKCEALTGVAFQM